MSQWVSKEATLAEVMAEVSLADAGRVLKSTLAGVGSLVLLIAIIGIVSAVAHPFVPDFTVPGVVWRAIVVFVVVSVFTADKSWHGWTIGFYFPKLRFFGWLMLTAYITATIEALRATADLKPDFLGMGAYILLVWLPVMLFHSVTELGHGRLMAKRMATQQE
jgi:hypothetical protein